MTCVQRDQHFLALRLSSSRLTSLSASQICDSKFSPQCEFVPFNSDYQYQGLPDAALGWESTASEKAVDEISNAESTPGVLKHPSQLSHTT